MGERREVLGVSFGGLARGRCGVEEEELAVHDGRREASIVVEVSLKQRQPRLAGA
jgi:hypothetical protein